MAMCLVPVAQRCPRGLYQRIAIHSERLLAPVLVPFCLHGGPTILSIHLVAPRLPGLQRRDKPRQQGPRCAARTQANLLGSAGHVRGGPYMQALDAGYSALTSAALNKQSAEALAEALAGWHLTCSTPPLHLPHLSRGGRPTQKPELESVMHPTGAILT